MGVDEAPKSKNIIGSYTETHVHININQELFDIIVVYVKISQNEIMKVTNK